MAKGNFKGMVVGGDFWEVENEGGKKKGYSYKVLTQDEKDENTGLCKKCAIVSVTGNEFIEEITSGAFVEFSGEFKNGFNGANGKMRYSDIRLVKSVE